MLVVQVRASDPGGRPLTGPGGRAAAGVWSTPDGRLGPAARRPAAGRARRRAVRGARSRVGPGGGGAGGGPPGRSAEQAGPATFAGAGAAVAAAGARSHAARRPSGAGTALLAEHRPPHRGSGARRRPTGSGNWRRCEPRRPCPTPEQIPLRPPLALAALALFLADVASRRANFRAPGPATGQG